MIRFIVRKKNDGAYAGLSVEGHAKYGSYGKDIVCAAVSVLTLNTVNSIETLTENVMSVREGGKGGALEVDFPEGLDEKGKLLMDALVMGIRDVEQQYGSGYVNVSESVSDGK